MTLLLPIGEAALLALTESGLVPEHIHLPWPAAPVIRRVLDKAAVLAHAQVLGLGVPEQRECGGRDEALDAIRAFGGLVALKPARSVGESDGLRRRVGVVLPDDMARAEIAVAELAPQAWPLLVQRRIVGEGIGVFVLRWNGDVLATFAHRRLREKPPSGGVSVISESAARDSLLESQAIALLEALDWNGVAMVEFKRDDSAAGHPMLMEINGRFWGSLQLAIDAGVNFPVLLACAALGERVDPVRSWPERVRLRWVLGDVDHLLIAAKDAWRRRGWAGVWTAWRTWRGLDGADAKAELGGRGDNGPMWREMRRWFWRR